MRTKISFIGLGKLGLPLATNFIKKGFFVEGIDLNETTIKTLHFKVDDGETDLQSNIDLSSR